MNAKKDYIDKRFNYRFRSVRKGGQPLEKFSEFAESEYSDEITKLVELLADKNADPVQRELLTKMLARSNSSLFRTLAVDIREYFLRLALKQKSEILERVG